jgi:predicted nucleic acid-binding protein
MNRTVISDTSCLIALVKIGMLDILNELFDEVVITNEVYNEFSEALPHWIKVVDVENKQKQSELEFWLDKGEASSITLAIELGDATLIIDESKGRKIAISFNLKIIGTIGILILAKEKGIINDVVSIMLKLTNEGFRLSKALIERIIQVYGQK